MHLAAGKTAKSREFFDLPYLSDSPLTSPRSYGVIFPNPYFLRNHDEQRTFSRNLVRVDIYAKPPYSSGISIHEFQDTYDYRCWNFEFVPNIKPPDIPTSSYATKQISSTQPNTLAASISWEQTSGKYMLVLTVKLIDTTPFGALKRYFLPLLFRPSFL